MDILASCWRQSNRSMSTWPASSGGGRGNTHTTLELPFLRTSPDHGAGFDIAAAGIARADSMVAALRAAWDLSTIRRA